MGYKILVAAEKRIKRDPATKQPVMVNGKVVWIGLIKPVLETNGTIICPYCESLEVKVFGGKEPHLEHDTKSPECKGFDETYPRFLPGTEIPWPL